MAERKALIDHNDPLTLSRQAKLLNVTRSSISYLPKPISKADQQLMMRIDKLHLEFPLAGTRMLRGLLRGLLRQVGFTIQHYAGVNFRECLSQR